MTLTPSLAVDVSYLALNDGGVQETFVRDPQAPGGLVLVTFARILWGSYGLERGCGYCVVENPRQRIGFSQQPSRTDQVTAHGML